MHSVCTVTKSYCNGIVSVVQKKEKKRKIDKKGNIITATTVIIYWCFVVSKGQAVSHEGPPLVLVITYCNNGNKTFTRIDLFIFRSGHHVIPDHLQH